LVETGHGTRLGILTDLHGPECRITGRQATCTVSQDQAVGAPGGGPRVWQVIVVKTSQPAAVVEVTLTYLRRALACWSEPPRRHGRLANGSVVTHRPPHPAARWERSQPGSDDDVSPAVERLGFHR